MYWVQISARRDSKQKKMRRENLPETERNLTARNILEARRRQRTEAIAYEQDLVFGRVKRVSRNARASGEAARGREGELATIPYKFSFVLHLACVASVSSRGSSRKPGQEQKKIECRRREITMAEK